MRLVVNHQTIEIGLWPLNRIGFAHTIDRDLVLINLHAHRTCGDRNVEIRSDQPGPPGSLKQSSGPARR